MAMHVVDRGDATKQVVMSGILLVTWGVCAGFVVGLCIVHVLGWLGLVVDTEAGTLLRQVLLP